MIKVIMSKFPEENSLFIYKDIEKKLEKKEKSFLIVPEQYTLESDMDFIDSIKYKSVMDAKVLSFSSLISYISQRLSLKKHENLNQVSKTILLTNVLDEIDDKLKLFSNKASDIDFVNNLSDFISNIKEYYFDRDFFDQIENNENLDTMTKLKFKEIKIIYDSYVKKLENSYIDSEDELSIIKDNIKYCDFLKNVNFYFDKFDLLSDLKLDFIKELIKIGGKITVSISLDSKYYENHLANDMEIFEQSLRFVESVKNLGQSQIINLEKKSDILDIKHLYENFEKYNPEKFWGKTSNIKIVESISSTNEIENMTLMIEKLIRKGYSYSDISIVMTNEDEYENLIRRIFSRMDIPIFIDKSQKMSDNHVVKTWLSLLRLVVFNFRKTDIESFIRSDLIDFGENSLERVLAFQKYINTRKIKGSMIFDDTYFTLDENFYKDEIKKEKQEELDKVNSIRNIILDLIKDLYEMRNKNLSASLIVKEIFKVIDNGRIKSGFNHYQEYIKENKIEIHEENKQIWDKFITILEQIVSIMKDSKTNLRKIYKLIQKASEATSIGLIPPAIDQVLIGDFSRDRINDRKIKIFVGMTDIYFPENNNSEMLISENEKSLLENEGFDLKIYKEKKNDKILLNILRMFTSSQKIIFSYSLINKNNEAMNRSTSISDIINIFPNINYQKISKGKFEHVKYSKDLLDLKAYQILWDIKEKEKVSDREKEFVKAYLQYKKDFSKNFEFNKSKNSSYDLFMKGFAYSNDKNPLNKEISKRLYNKNRFSVSEIERYARCPYKYFIDYGLKAQKNKNLDVDMMEIGNIVHYNMENISKNLRGIDIENLDDKKLENLVKENFKKAIESSLEKMRANDNKNKFILSNVYASTQKSTKKVLDQIKKGKFQIDSVEEKYGKGQKYPEVYVDDENFLEGRIDRIDRFEDFVRIIDYKTGSTEINIKYVFNGIQLQLFVYMLSVKEKKFENLSPVASFYLPLKDEVQKIDDPFTKKTILDIYNKKTKMNGLIIKINEEVLKLLDEDFNGKKSDIFKISRGKVNIFTPEEEVILEKFIKKLISNYICQIKDGNIKLNPLRTNKNSYECINCDFRSICKFDYTIDQDKFRDLNNEISLAKIKKELSDE
ncbi:MAG: PD-(D/E)XK nuclease family protein [Anaerococcus hydrogenalis]|uniref:PD-(D/E)XK nuclease family protein n=1 Tax=Anaerococcus hydrogenalis TaxID=33029 RepID=UPI00290B2218|nr:PD-(D/E)XK nuclease family protein [Anaerococcus hydrogenalis]MDU3687616.1 PD-(D/E)XK nuclease family protein [Anaerococcus hydrogenalis]